MQKKAQDTNSGEDLFTITGGTPLPKSVTEAQELAAEGKTDEANKKIGEALAQNPADEAKYELYVQQGVNYQNEGKNAEALAEYRKAEAVRLDFRLARLIGDVAVILDNKALAIEYYKKAIPLIDPDNPIKDAEKQTLEEKIKALGGQV
jgi:tetratricopeptide (TPR) repeat protein